MNLRKTSWQKGCKKIIKKLLYRYSDFSFLIIVRSLFHTIFRPILISTCIFLLTLGGLFVYVDKNSPRKTISFNSNSKMLLIDNSVMDYYSSGINIVLKSHDPNTTLKIVSGQTRDINAYVGNNSIPTISYTNNKINFIQNETNELKHSLLEKSDLWIENITKKNNIQLLDYENPSNYKTQILLGSTKGESYNLQITFLDDSYGYNAILFFVSSSIIFLLILFLTIVFRIQKGRAIIPRHMRGD